MLQDLVRRSGRQFEIARLAGISPCHLSHILNGHRQPSVGVLNRLLDAVCASAAERAAVLGSFAGPAPTCRHEVRAVDDGARGAA
ncbi:MAG: helix-turn-helix transcriptional regulator [Deltaproteobacteria bacterium]|jgi:transcriptional regulator with XRE-family HTH domain|nr:helix-turn-helix transcriptional regulator [Deltaproteobacteria bacterium]